MNYPNEPGLFPEPPHLVPKSEPEERPPDAQLQRPGAQLCPGSGTTTWAIEPDGWWGRCKTCGREVRTDRNWTSGPHALPLETDD